MPSVKSLVRLQSLISRERGLVFGWATVICLTTYGSPWLKHIPNPWVAAFFLLWLVAAILFAAFAVVRRADALARRLGEPFGTLVLTLSVTGMEVSMLAAVMLTGPENPTLARDTMFAVVMIALGGLVGCALLLGAFRHGTQAFNMEGASAYLSLIVPLSLFGLVMPNLTVTTSGPTFSVFQALVLAALCIGSYIIFLGIQTLRHRDFFSQESESPEGHEDKSEGVWTNTVFLFLGLIPVVILAEQLAHVLDYGHEVYGLPSAFSGMIVAALILSPEGLSAILAARHNHMQRSVNLLLGSVLATLSLTIPCIIILGLVTQRKVDLGLSPPDCLLLAVMLAVSFLTFARGKTNLLQGAVHLLIFIFWLTLLFEG